ncbi:MAG TPA: methyltransferase domain-containing protein [Bryobacteraceae bacterium]|nr:methyltransferase domain-containing protein [Bryobacteraceae bacterium]
MGHITEDRQTVSGNIPTLYQAVEWRRALWLGPTRFAIGDPRRFRGKSVLDLGSRDGAMASYFQSLGASVQAADIKDPELEAISRRGIDCFKVDPLWDELPRGRYDFVFTKSVLVRHPDLDAALINIRRALRPGGEYLAVENYRSGMNQPLRAMLAWRKWARRASLTYLNGSNMRKFEIYFGQVERRWGPFGFAVGVRAKV